MQSNAIASCILLLLHNVCCFQDNWVEPNAWSELTTPQYINPADESCQCQALPTEEKSLATIEDQLALMYFRKFVNTLFSRKTLMFSKTSKLYKRSMLFTLEASDLESLETVEDVRDLDIMLSKILNKAKDVPLSYENFDDDYAYGHQEMGVRALVMDIFKDMLQLLKISEVKFMLTVLLIVAAGWAVHRRFRFSIIAIIIGGVFLYGYLVTYLECNRKLEIDAVIDVIDSHQKTSDDGWFSRIFGNLFKESPDEIQKQKLLKSSKLQMPYCRPDHVFIMYTSEIFLKQIEMILEKTMHTISSLNSGLSLPFSLIAPMALVCMVAYIIKLFFKYVISPRAWMGFMHGRPRRASLHAQEQIQAREAGGDRLSGENLKILLNVIGTTGRTQSQQQLTLPVSGVQEVLESLEAPPAQLPQKSKSKSRENLDSSPKECSNVSNSSADIAHEAGFTVVDDNDDVDSF